MLSIFRNIKAYKKMFYLFCNKGAHKYSACSVLPITLYLMTGFFLLGCVSQPSQYITKNKKNIEKKILTSKESWILPATAMSVQSGTLNKNSYQISGLQNKTNLRGDNFLLAVAQKKSNKLQSFDQSKILDDLKLSIQPFKSTSNRAMRQRNYDLGKIFWKEEYIGGDVICVLAFRKLDDTRLLQSIEVFDVHLLLRNCVKDNLDNALLPISSPNFNLQNLTSVHTASPEKFKRSVLAGPNG